MSLLPIVYAHLDDGPQSEITRWKPRRVFCTNDPFGSHNAANGLYVVKFLQGQVGAAALISEVVCTSLYRSAGLLTLDPFIVQADAAFAASFLTRTDMPYEILPGYHFGTLHRSDVAAGPPPEYGYLANPAEIIRLWVFDSWVNDIDREMYGNILMSIAGNGQFDIIAADQSDCFCGAATFCSGEFTRINLKSRSAPSVPFLATIIYENGGPKAIREAITQVREAAKNIVPCLRFVPESWWQLSRIDPRTVEHVLQSRANRLEEILNPNDWEIPNVGNAILL